MTEDEIDYEVLTEEIGEIDFSFKIIVIGDSAVGKSSLTLRGAKDKYKDFYTPTIGFEFLSFTIKIKNQIIKLQIWDTCGQEVYRSLISSFYRNSSLAILVYAINNQESFDSLETWLDEIKTQTHPNLKIFLIGNKIDLEDQRVVSKEAGEELAKDHNLNLFMETSAKTGINAREVFIRAAKMLLEEYKKLFQEEGMDPNITGDKSSISLSSQEKENFQPEKIGQDPLNDFNPYFMTLTNFSFIEASLIPKLENSASYLSILSFSLTVILSITVYEPFSLILDFTFSASSGLTKLSANIFLTVSTPSSIAFSSSVAQYIPSKYSRT